MYVITPPRTFDTFVLIASKMATFYTEHVHALRQTISYLRVGIRIVTHPAKDKSRSLADKLT